MIKTNLDKYDHTTNTLIPIYKAPSNTFWTLLGMGNFNCAFKKIDNTQVLKIQKDQDDLSDSPQRSVRLWNLVNQHVAANAQLEYHADGSVLGWVCPFIEGVSASDAEIVDALVEIFNRTRRIITDATAANNFITTAEGQTVCVDVGMALEFDSPFIPPALRRQVSAVSLSTWQTLRPEYPAFFHAHHQRSPDAIDTIKALIFIQENRPEITCADFLINKPLLRTSFVHGYEAQRRGQFPAFALDLLDDQHKEPLTERPHHAASVTSNPLPFWFFQPSANTNNPLPHSYTNPPNTHSR